MALDFLGSCTLCPGNCQADRINGETGICKTGRYAKISSYGSNFGEEPPLTGIHDSGTIFFTHGNLLCNFCQNYDISHRGRGQEVTDEQLGSVMLELQDQGCHNINLVTPSHVIPQILGGLKYAVEKGLNIPLVYNTDGYDYVESPKLLDGVVDIYMPDLKFLSGDKAKICGLSAGYPEVEKRRSLKCTGRWGIWMWIFTGLPNGGVSSGIW